MQPLSIPIRQMAAQLGVHPQTLRRWERAGKIPKAPRTIGNHRRYQTAQPEATALTVGYVRVSSHDQKADLNRQQQYVQEKAGKPVDLIIKDLGSAMNYKKSGFKQLLLLLLQGKVKELILTHKDRLLRFGSEIIFQICSHFGVTVTILDQSEELPPMEKFCRDLVEIMTVFCSKIYGHRSHQNRQCSSSLNSMPTAN